MDCGLTLRSFTACKTDDVGWPMSAHVLIWLVVRNAGDNDSKSRFDVLEAGGVGICSRERRCGAQLADQQIKGRL